MLWEPKMCTVTIMQIHRMHREFTTEKRNKTIVHWFKGAMLKYQFKRITTHAHAASPAATAFLSAEQAAQRYLNHSKFIISPRTATQQSESKPESSQLKF